MPRPGLHPGWLAAALLLPAFLAAVAGMAPMVPHPSALIWPDPADMAQVVAADSLLPRFVASLLCGAGLGLAGALSQLALRNPLASPGTLGISAGAFLALAAASLYAPGLLDMLGRDAVAFAGGAAGVGLVLALCWRGGLDPAAVALAGLAVGLYAGSLGVVLALLHTHVLSGLFVWNSGSLVQGGWAVPRQLAWRLVLAGGLVLLVARPLRLLDLPDEVARGLGVPVPLVRLAALFLAVGLGGSVVALVGVIGFVGLGAPALVRASGGHRRMLVWAPVLGAGLLAATDQAVQRASGLFANLLPTGAATALLGLPLLLWLLRRVAPAMSTAAVATVPPARRPGATLLAGVGVLAVLATGAALLGAGDGWSASAALLPQRLPRVVAAGMAGALLAVAGTILQRILGNPMASPEILGLGMGAATGIGAAAWFGLGGVVARVAAGSAGGGAVLALLLAFARGGGATRLLLAGIALSSGFEAVVSVVMASGDPRTELLLAVLSGSTYGADAGLAAVAVGAGAVLLGGAALATRWLTILPLGDAVAAGLGVPVARARWVLLALVAAATSVATLLAGPLSFVGLLSPQLARLLGFGRSAHQVAMAAVIGAGVMVLADWLGRVVLFPSEIPAGLVASLVGGPFLLWALARRRA